MPAFFRCYSSQFAVIRNGFLRCRYGIALLWLLLIACGVAAAQTTTISGTVYDPRLAAGKPNPLPLPNVLVYASTSAVAPPPSGVQCLTSANQTPTGANVVPGAFTNTAVDGSFTLQDIPENATYTIVIQAGKWQRQFTETVGTSPLTGLQLSMPANHTQGNMPYIAIATGSVDGAECVLRDMGISDSEFTDDKQTVNAGGYVHLYRGSSSPGADINASTPSETVLMTTNQSGTTTPLLNEYDMVMFPCQSNASNQATATGAGNLLSFAEAGGRIFATHYSYAWLDPAAPYGAQFGDVANWTISQEHDFSAEVGTVQENFSDGIFLAEWLHNAGSTVSGTLNQIDIGTLRTDVGSVVAPAQPWVTLNNGTYVDSSINQPVTITNNPVMQMTFNVPFGAPAASQCGRVMYNDYHVIDASTGGKTYPTECPSYCTSGANCTNSYNTSYKMSAQEEMLEYALFDLSGFVQPTVVPTVTVTFAPSPLTVKSGDATDQLTVNVNSGTTQTDSSAVLSFTLPTGLTITGMSDPTGGWVCTVSTLSCARTTALVASTTDSVVLTISVATYTTLSSYSGTITATVSSAIFSTNPSFNESVIFQQAPSITWATPANIIYGTPLSGAQLNASSTVAGTFAYSPVAGTVLGTGKQTLNTTFTPTDAVDYTTETASVTLTVVPGTPTITITSSANSIFTTAAVTFTASLPAYASTETGTMTFYYGSTAIGTATVSGGSATLTTTSLPAGIQSITAVYSGDADYGPGTSSAITETVQDFTLAFASGIGTVTGQPGGQAAYSLVVTPTNGTLLPGAVTLSASNLPLGMTASFSPATISSGSAATTVTMTITLPGKAANERPKSPFGGAFPMGLGPVALGLILLPVDGRMRKARARLARLMVLLVIGAALAVGFTGCGAKTSAQNFTFSVTATSGALSHSLTPGLTVE